jgi:uncharacterized protein YjdB
VLKSEFSNYSAVFGRGNYLVRELLALVMHAEQYPGTTEQLQTLFNADVARVQAAITTVLSRRPAVSLDLTPATVTMAVGATRQLTATPTPDPAAGTTTYVSSNTSRATVNSSGLVTGVAVGTATITATRGTATDTTAITVTAS